MTVNKRLLELAVKGLEVERQRIDSEIDEITQQLAGGAARTSAPSQTASSTSGSKESASANAPRKRGALTSKGRKALSEAMKRRWAERRKAASTGTGGSAQAKQSASSASGSKEPAAKTSRKRGALTAKGRKALSEAMTRRWAERRKAAAKAAK